MDNQKPSNPRIQEFDGVYASDAYKSINDYFSLRDYFAAKAMSSLIAPTDFNEIRQESNNSVSTKIAEIAYKIADAMLKQREQ